MPIKSKSVKPKVSPKPAKVREGMEIERKFLLKSVPSIVGSNLPIYITQYYIDQNGKRVRLRESHQAKVYTNRGKTRVEYVSKYDNTTKTRIRDGVYNETITWIDRKVYEKLTSKAHRVISKRRYEFPCVMNGVKLKWEFDEFKSPMSLVVVEIEVPYEGFKIKLPKFIKDVLIMEVTHLKEFTNYSLAEQL